MTTVILLFVFGAYMFASGIGIARKPATARKVLEELEASPALTITTGAFTFFLGVALISIHNQWTDIFAGFVSFFGWSAAAQGLLLLAAPELVFGFAKRLAPSDGIARLFGVIVLAVGASFLFISFPAVALSAPPV